MLHRRDCKSNKHRLMTALPVAESPCNVSSSNRDRKDIVLCTGDVHAYPCCTVAALLAPC
jgi:hypothetical protein